VCAFGEKNFTQIIEKIHDGSSFTREIGPWVTINIAKTDGNILLHLYFQEGNIQILQKSATTKFSVDATSFTVTGATEADEERFLIFSRIKFYS